MKPKNQHQLAIWYLITFDNLTLKFIINDSMFFKFQTRLSEIEAKEMRNLATRERVRFKNRFGHSSSYVKYSAIDKDYLKSIFDKY